MPYVTQSRRNTNTPPEVAGDLHYDIARLIDAYLFARPGKPFNYQACNDVIGVLACAQAEVYRRIIGPYEDTKIEENGDVYSVKPTDPSCIGPCACNDEQ